MRKNYFAALAVINGPAGKVSSDRHTHDCRTLETVAGAPTDHGKLVAKLHHRRPDVVEELNFNYGLEPARGHADRAADDVGFGERSIEHAVGAVLALEPGGRLKNAAL